MCIHACMYNFKCCVTHTEFRELFRPPSSPVHIHMMLPFVVAAEWCRRNGGKVRLLNRRTTTSSTHDTSGECLHIFVHLYRTLELDRADSGQSTWESYKNAYKVTGCWMRMFKGYSSRTWSRVHSNHSGLSQCTEYVYGIFSCTWELIVATHRWCSRHAELYYVTVWQTGTTPTTEWCLCILRNY